MSKLFISYKRGTDGVQKLVKDLDVSGYLIWLDRNDIYLGADDWQREVDDALAECDGVIVCLTKAASESKAVQYEVKKAVESDKPLFPIVLENPSNLKTYLRKSWPIRAPASRGFHVHRYVG